jgi:ribokinase
VVARVARLPRADEKESATLVGEFPGGMGANVASSFATLGGRAALVSSVGDDERGRRCLADLRATGVDVEHVLTIADATFWTIALLDAQGEKSLVEFSTRASAPQWERIDWGVLEGVRVAYTVGAEGRHACRLFAECRRRGVTTALDVETADLRDVLTLRELLAQTDLLFAPAGYARAIAQTQSLPQAARRLLDAGPSVVAITGGDSGCLVADGAGLTEIPGHAVAVVDTTGAGDCFAGAFLYGFVRDWPVEDCAAVANLMAAQSVTAYGCRGRLLGLAQLAALPAAAGLEILR